MMLAMTGAGGKLGGAVASALLRRTPSSTLRLGTRTPHNLARLATAGAEILHANFDDPASLERLFQGCAVALVVSGDEPNERRIRQHAAAFEAAKHAGVARIGYTSFANPVVDSRFLIAASHAESERLLGTLGPAFTGARPENSCVNRSRADVLYRGYVIYISRRAKCSGRRRQAHRRCERIPVRWRRIVYQRCGASCPHASRDATWLQAPLALVSFLTEAGVWLAGSGTACSSADRRCCSLHIRRHHDNES